LFHGLADQPVADRRRLLEAACVDDATRAAPEVLIIDRAERPMPD
jgi:hypothetical protein